MPLLRGIARTAAIAGTATAVSNRVSRRQQNRWAQQDDQQYAQQPQQPQQQKDTNPANVFAAMKAGSFANDSAPQSAGEAFLRAVDRSRATS